MTPVLKRLNLDPFSATATVRRGQVLVVTAALLAIVFGLRIVFEDPSDAVGALYVLPIAFIAVFLGTRWGLFTAAVSFGMLVLGVVVTSNDISVVGYLARLFFFVGSAILVGEVAAHLRAAAAASLEAERKLSTVVSTVLEGFIEMDADGRITEINEEAQKLFGWSREDVLGRDLALTLLPEERRPEFRGALRAVLAGDPAPLFGQWHDEWTALRRDGTTLIVEWLVAPVFHDGEWNFPVWVFDVTGRVRADEARARLASIIDHAQEAFVMTNADGIIQAWNPKATTTFGWTAEEAIGRRIEDTIIPEPFRESYRARLQEFLTTGDTTGIDERVEVEGLHKLGHSFPIEMTISAVETEDGWSFHAFMHDISARRREDSERSRMASIVEASADAIFSYSLDGVVTSWNRGAERLYGFTAAEMVGTEISRIVPPDRPRDVDRILSYVQRGERLENYETVRVEKGGRLIDVSLTVSPVRDEADAIVEAAVTARDISERKRHDAYRQAQHQATRLLAETADPADAIGELLEILARAVGWPCGAIWYRDGDDMLMRCVDTWFNPGIGEGLCPFEPGDVLELDEPPVRRITWEQLGGPSSVVPGAGRALGAGIGTLLWVPVSIEGTMLGAVELMTRRRLERDEPAIAMTSAVSSLLTELLRRRHAESEAERLKDEFFGMVSHEMRTPLTSIIGYTELLADFEAENLSEQGRGFLDVIERNARREMRLVGDLLALVRIEAGSFGVEPEMIDLASVARASVDASSPRAEAEKVTLTAELAEMPRSLGDPHRLGQVVDNLLSNAIKFTPEYGVVELRLRRDGETAVLEVADTGIGIPDDEQEKLFERLYRASSATDRHIPGLGLGLTITKAIVEAHDGRISVESEIGKGTTFRVELPLRQDDGEPGADDEAEEERGTVEAAR
jgi:PAS domain S-box-containing protein